jgi:putative peptidoglycan lipid II flippase
MKRKNNFLRNGALLLFNQQTNILSAAMVIMINVLASRILGLLRDRLLATYFGSSAQLGVYFAAFRLPDMIFQLLVMGALATAFIPVITSLITRGQKSQAWYVSSSVLNIGLLIFAALAILIFCFAYPLSRLIAPGFNHEELILMSRLTRIMLLAQFFFILSNFLTGILQSFKHFMVPALAPVFYNLGIILGIVLFTPALGIFGAAWGVVLGTILHFLIQLPLAKKLGVVYQPIFDYHNSTVKKIGQLMLPRTIGLAVAQIDYTVDIVLASLISTSSLIYFNFAQHLQMLPVGLFGATIAQAALPTLAETAEKQGLSVFKKTFLSCFHQILFLILPCSVLLIILRIPIVRLVFGAARFDWEATVTTGLVLAFFSISLFAQSLVHLLARAFYALQNTKIPVIIGGFSVLSNVLISVLFVLVFHWSVWALALSTSIANILNVLLLLIYLDKKVNGFKRNELFLPALKTFAISFLTAFALYLPMKFLDQVIFDTTRVSGLMLLTGVAALAGAGFYLFLAWVFKIEALKTFVRLLEKIELIQKIIRGQSLEPIGVTDESTGFTA